MNIRIDLSVWLKGQQSRGLDIPVGKEDRMPDALKRYAAYDFAELLQRAELPADFFDAHIDAFVAGLGGEDRDYTYRWPGEDAADVRVVIENECPATIERKSAWMKDLLDNLPPPQPGFDRRIITYEDGQIRDQSFHDR